MVGVYDSEKSFLIHVDAFEKAYPDPTRPKKYMRFRAADKFTMTVIIGASKWFIDDTMLLSTQRDDLLHSLIQSSYRELDREYDPNPDPSSYFGPWVKWSLLLDWWNILLR